MEQTYENRNTKNAIIRWLHKTVEQTYRNTKNAIVIKVTP